MKPKPATRAPRNSKRSHRFSLVSAEAQQQMYRAIRAMGSANGGGAQGWSELSGTPGSLEQSSGGPGAPAVGVLGWSGAEIAEIAVCLAAGESCPLVLACPAPGARLVSDGARVIGGDSDHDLAVLKVNATSLPTVPLGDSSKVQLGEPVIALGYEIGRASCRERV